MTSNRYSGIAKVGKMKRALQTGIVIGLLGVGITPVLANEVPLDQLMVSPAETNTIKVAENAPLQIIVSRKDQNLRVFRGTEVIATSKVSTGKKGHATPTGIFSILEKNRIHHSNLYNSAPMPWMQRLTWSGVALHESNSVPSYPASHGCVRMPGAFARELFGLTERGAHVIIADREATPAPIESEQLFQPRDMTPEEEREFLRSSMASKGQGLGKISLLSEYPPLDPVAYDLAKRLNRFEDIRKGNKPLRVFITREAHGQLVREIQIMLNALGFDAGDVDGFAGKDTYTAVRRFLDSKKGSIETRSTSMAAHIDKALLQQLYDAAGKGKVPTGHLFVRYNFKPLFDAPIHIRETDKPLGVHLFVASSSVAEEGKLDWLAVDLGDKLMPDMQSRLGVLQDKQQSGLVNAEDVLDRIEIPQKLRMQISHLINNGSSLTISDRGFSRETTDVGTDFIVLTKPTLPAVNSPKQSVVKKVALKKNMQRKKVARSEGLEKISKPQRRGIFRLFRGGETSASR